MIEESLGAVKLKWKVKYDFWPIGRPYTKKWGSGSLFDRISRSFERPDVAFGKTDGIPDDLFYVDRSNGYEWSKLPFANNQFKFGYFDPPYDRLYRKETIEIWRCVERLAILHIYIIPHAWLQNSKREAMIAVTFGPKKQVRCLQVYRKIHHQLTDWS